MSDAPERLVTSKCGKTIVTAGMKMFDSDVGYIREDLYDAERAENALLREALVQIAWNDDPNHDYPSIARAALETKGARGE